MRIIDISPTLEASMLGWPTGRPTATHRVVDEGDGTTPRNSEWRLDSHAGAHVDAPLHWLPDGVDVSRIPLDALIGPCRVVQIDTDGPIEPGEIPGDAIFPGARLLLRTSNSTERLVAPFDETFAALTPGAAAVLAAAGVALVGIDYLSIEPFGGDGEVHRTLLAAGVYILEGLDLRAVEPADYMLAALPLKLAGGEASPVRAALWR